MPERWPPERPPCWWCKRTGSGSGTRTRDTAIMSRLLYRLSYPAVVIATSVDWLEQLHQGCRYSTGARRHRNEVRAPMRNRTADLLLTMETLYRLSYRGLTRCPIRAAPTHQDTHSSRGQANRLNDPEAGPRAGSTGFAKASPGRKTSGAPSHPAMSGPLGVAGVGFEPT